jgi:hypothetical protein
MRTAWTMVLWRGTTRPNNLGTTRSGKETQLRMWTAQTMVLLRVSLTSLS